MVGQLISYPPYKLSSKIRKLHTNFKARWRNHQTSFNNEKSKNGTELSKYIWALKNKNERYTIGWKILEKAKPYTNLTGKCQLCTAEKHFIITKPELATLNKRNERVSACRHRRKFILRYSSSNWFFRDFARALMIMGIAQVAREQVL